MPTLLHRLSTTRLELAAHLLGWGLYGYLACCGRGSFWDDLNTADVWATFLAFPLAFFANLLWLVPRYFNRHHWVRYGVLLVLLFFAADLLRTLAVLAAWPANTVRPNWTEIFLGQYNLFVPVAVGYLLSFAYATARSWRRQAQVIVQLQHDKIAAEQAAHPATAAAPIEPKPAADFLFVNTGSARKRLFYNDILYISGEGNYVSYVTSAEKVLVRAYLKDVLPTLPAGAFFQIHRSHIVGLRRIEKVEDNHVFVAGERLPIGASFRSAFWERLDAL